MIPSDHQGCEGKKPRAAVLGLAEEGRGWRRPNGVCRPAGGGWMSLPYNASLVRDL